MWEIDGQINKKKSIFVSYVLILLFIQLQRNPFNKLETANTVQVRLQNRCGILELFCSREMRHRLSVQAEVCERKGRSGKLQVVREKKRERKRKPEFVSKTKGFSARLSKIDFSLLTNFTERSCA